MQLDAADAASAKDQSSRQYAPGTRAFIAQCLNHASKHLRLSLAHLPESVAIFGRNPQRGRALNHVGHGWMLFLRFGGLCTSARAVLWCSTPEPEEIGTGAEKLRPARFSVEPGR